MTPTVVWCTHKCIFCWRPVEHTLGDKLPPHIDDPKFIVEESIKAQKELLIGYKGYKEKIDLEKLEKTFSPTNVAISLAGEPTLYPRLSELIAEYQKRGMTTFLVTNGTNPDMIKKLSPLPTQLYISLDAPDHESYLRIDRPYKDQWDNIMESISLLREIKCRTVIRLTLLDSFNMYGVKKYAEIIEKGEPKYIEAKAYMHVGFSTKRVPRCAMPLHKKIKNFAIELEKELKNYKIVDEKQDSRVVLFKRKDIIT
jgi:tRNA wybutosine-synthesizing protein 1